MYRKLLVALLLAIFASHLVSAQQSSQAWWYTLEEGKFLLRSGAYGDAFTAFENARRARQTQFTRMEQDFIRVLSIPDVRRLGDSLDFVERYIDARGETSAASALAYLYHHTPRSSFGGSASRALSGFDRLKSFPEAEYWLGETYRAEGELAMSLRHYERALAERELLQTPNFDVEILYRMTDVHRVRQEYQEMERRAIEVITGTNASGALRDELWVRGTIRPAMARLLENEGIHRFLSLYRYNNTLTERAHRLLGFYYHATNRLIPAVDHLTFAFLIQNTILIEDILRRDNDFTFTTLEDLIERVMLIPALAELTGDLEYFRTVFYFSSALYATGKTTPAMQLWTFLAETPHSGIWGQRARRNPIPYLESPLEMP